MTETPEPATTEEEASDLEASALTRERLAKYNHDRI